MRHLIPMLMLATVFGAWSHAHGQEGRDQEATLNVDCGETVCVLPKGHLMLLLANNAAYSKRAIEAEKKLSEKCTATLRVIPNDGSRKGT